MYLKDKKIIFIHIPKTAGTAVEDAFCKHVIKYKFNYTKNGKYIKINIPDRHKTLYEIVSKNNIENLGEYFKFTVVRNTYDRILSTYQHNNNKKKSTYREYLLNIKSYFDNPDNFITVDDTKIFENEEDKDNNLMLMDKRHILPIGHWFDDKDMNYIMRYDNIRNDWVSMKRRYDYLLDLKKVNNNPDKDYSKHYRVYYQLKDIKILKSIYGEEIKKYDFRCE